MREVCSEFPQMHLSKQTTPKTALTEKVKVKSGELSHLLVVPDGNRNESEMAQVFWLRGSLVDEG